MNDITGVAENIKALSIMYVILIATFTISRSSSLGIIIIKLVNLIKSDL